MRGMLSLLAGLGQGYNSGTQQQFENDRKTKIDQIAIDRAAREGVEFGQAQQDRSDMRAAGAPIEASADMVTDAEGRLVQREIKPDSADNSDVGQPGTAPNMPALRVGMQGMLTKPQADAAVTAQNAPEAMQARQMQAMARIDPAKAMKFRADAITLKNAELDSASKDFDAGLNRAANRGVAALVEWTNASSASTQKSAAVPSADGKMVEIHSVGEDGKLTPTGLVYENSAKGAAEAATMLSRSVPPDVKLKHYMAERESNRREAHDATDDKYKTGMLGVAQRNAATNEDYKDKIGDAAGVRADKTGAGRASAFERMSDVDKAAFADINKQRETIAAAVTKAQAEGSFDENSPGAKQLKTRLNALNLRASAITAKYGDGDAASADPLGERKPAAGAAPQPAAPAGNVREQMRVSPATQAARDADRPAILAAEYVKAKPDDQTAQMAEIRRLPPKDRDRALAMIASGGPQQIPGTAPASPAAPAAPATTMRSVAQPQPAPQVQQAPPLTRPAAPTAALAPLEVAGQRLDAARTATSVATVALQRYGLRQRAADPQGYQAAFAAVQAAKAAQDAAEQAYAPLARQADEAGRAAMRPRA